MIVFAYMDNLPSPFSLARSLSLSFFFVFLIIFSIMHCLLQCFPYGNKDKYTQDEWKHKKKALKRASAIFLFPSCHQQCHA